MIYDDKSLMFEIVDRNDKFLTLNGVQSDLFHSVLEDTDEYHTLKVNKFNLIKALIEFCKIKFFIFI